jgi:hypothetical protein
MFFRLLDDCLEQRLAHVKQILFAWKEAIVAPFEWLLLMRARVCVCVLLFGFCLV